MWSDGAVTTPTPPSVEREAYVDDDSVAETACAAPTTLICTSAVTATVRSSGLTAPRCFPAAPRCVRATAAATTRADDRAGARPRAPPGCDHSGRRGGGGAVHTGPVVGGSVTVGPVRACSATAAGVPHLVQNRAPGRISAAHPAQALTRTGRSRTG